MSRPKSRRRASYFELAATVLGILAVVAALLTIWRARLSIDHDVYVSELGAPDLPTAGDFRVALLLIVVGAALIAFAARSLRSRGRLLTAWIPAVSLWAAAGGFLVASQVTCTAGCPVPYGPDFTWQDFIHTTVAVLAFAAACWGMLQIAFVRGHRGLAIMSLVSAVLVAVVAGAGGILSLLNFQVGLGSRFELVATSIGLLWIALLGGALGARRARELWARASPALASAEPISPRSLPQKEHAG
ncbi:DUF998 domain-containing protein [Lacisediminihabitans changchengi]|uniref:DUF998 domain-containing protein n=1 Tax=Lacisediminihabitans changchengi TaxID=2787634 RepID=A0A934SP40_9MICO|nr:DUF998 domain-containing protein [Lacisediminihabitans changchengi]MBK4349093.1 DUF998 domain-containing protein [Lacisediminihabitans changchengi]